MESVQFGFVNIALNVQREEEEEWGHCLYYYLVNDILFLPPPGFGCKNQKSLVLVMCMRVCVTSEIN